MADKKLNIKVRTKGAKKAKKDLKGVEGGMASMGKAAAVAGASFFAAKGLISGFSKIIELSGKQELAEKKLATALGKTSQALLQQARALQQVSMFGDEDIIMMQSMLASFVKGEEEIKLLTKATLDLAAGMGLDLKSAGDLVAKTIGSSTNAMSRYGIEVTGAVGSTERLETLTGNVAKLFGGQALAQSETLTGSIEQMHNAIGDVGEKMGDLFAPAIKDMAEFTKRAAERFGTFLGLVNKGRDLFTGLITKVGDLALEYSGLKVEIQDSTKAIVEQQSVTAFGEMILKLEAQKAAQLLAIDAQRKMADETKTGLGLFDAWINVLNVTADSLDTISKESIEKQFNESIKRLREEALKAGFSLEELNRSILKLGQDGEEDPSERVKKVSAAYFAAQKKLADKAAEELEIRKKMAQFASQTTISLGTSALMGDNVTESLKRAVIQLGLMVAQAKLFDFFMNTAKGFTPGGLLSTAVSFLFGASPTQAAPSASAASGSKIVINNNISGFGTIDSNFASNSLIPAINKAISTGQARIG
jgi:hypothetical protein